MRLLAIDLGFSNGWVYLVEDPQHPTSFDVHGFGTVVHDDLDEWLEQWRWPFESRENDDFHVVIERTAHGEFGPAARVLTSVTFKLTQAFPKATWTKAGQWKPITGSQPIPIKLGRHERDAYRLGLHYLFTKGLYRLVPTRHPASGTT